VDDPVLSFGESQMGDVTSGDSAAGSFTKINVSSDQAINLLSNNVAALTERLEVLERAEVAHANERQAMTRLIINLANESSTVTEVQHLLERQMVNEAAERDQRRRYLDTMLTSLIVLAFINLGMHILSRVRRLSGRKAQP
jgi:hypothetical protein